LSQVFKTNQTRAKLKRIFKQDYTFKFY